jgi:1-deoxy-D-xylulose-5-phosphate reductoisomerase
LIRVAVLGATGSIGGSTLEVIRRHPEHFEVVVLAAHRSAEQLAEQVQEFRPRAAVLSDPPDGFVAPGQTEADWAFGSEALVHVAERDDVDVVVNAIVGSTGLEATLRSLETGKRLALANKESLVAGGPLVKEAARRGGGELIPIDSEHSAILQCLSGSDPDRVSRLILTGSGGPFRGLSPAELEGVSPTQALQHPTWAMGSKITVDSATLANKALEVIEAHFLYDFDYDRIEAVLHPQSIVHSFVEFVDGSVVAQMGFPTMEIPILYALTHPDRIEDSSLRTFDPVRCSPLTFEPIDHEAFRMFGVGVNAGREGGTAPAVFNAANEVAVESFLDGRLSFPGMAEVVQETLERCPIRNVEGLEDVLLADAEARATAITLINARRSLPTG